MPDPVLRAKDTTVNKTDRNSSTMVTIWVKPYNHNVLTEIISWVKQSEVRFRHVEGTDQLNCRKERKVSKVYEIETSSSFTNIYTQVYLSCGYVLSPS